MPKMFGVKFPLQVLKQKLVFSTSGNIVAAATTAYIYSFDQGGDGILGGNYTVTETSCFVGHLVTRIGLLKNLMIRTYGSPGLGETFTYTVRVNGAPTALTCQIAGAVDYTASDLIDTVKVVVGDRITVEVVTSAAAVARSHLAAMELDVPAVRLPFERLNFTAISAIAAGTTRFFSAAGQLGLGSGGSGGSIGFEVYPWDGYLVVRKCSLKNLVIYASAAPGAGQTFVYTVRVNGVNTALTVTLSGAVQVTGTDILNVVQVDANDRITLQAVVSAGAAATTHTATLDFEEGDYRAG